MTMRLIRLWSWVGAHRLMAGWAVALVAIAVFGGGVALGSAIEPPARFPELPNAPTAKVGSTAVEGVVIGYRGAVLLVRTADGERVRVRTDEHTTYRLRKTNADASVVRRGSRVIVLGRPVGADVIRARAIAVRGQAKLPPPAPEAIDVSPSP